MTHNSLAAQINLRQKMSKTTLSMTKLDREKIVNDQIEYLL